jgi:hypothetical protein
MGGPRILFYPDAASLFRSVAITFPSTSIVSVSFFIDHIESVFALVSVTVECRGGGSGWGLGV